MNDSDENDEQPDPILRILGPSLVGRAKTGEIGVFSSIETQILILDAVNKAKNQTDIVPLKQIFEETKIPRARAHKLDRLVNERIHLLDGAFSTTAAANPVVTTTTHEETNTENQTIELEENYEDHSDESVNELERPIRYRMSDRLRELRATVRVRAAPLLDAEQIGLIHDEAIILVDGITPNWLRIQWTKPDRTQIRGWVVRASPDSQQLFVVVTDVAEEPDSASRQNKNDDNKETELITVRLEDFNRLVERVQRLEEELSALKQHLRSA